MNPVICPAAVDALPPYWAYSPAPLMNWAMPYAPDDGLVACRFQPASAISTSLRAFPSAPVHPRAAAIDLARACTGPPPPPDAAAVALAAAAAFAIAVCAWSSMPFARPSMRALPPSYITDDGENQPQMVLKTLIRS